MADPTVLIVEDDAAMQRGLKDNFEFEGYRVITASDGAEGLQSAIEVSPDLVVLDLMLPKMNGYEVCRRLRRRRLDMPILMLTAKTEESDLVLGLDIGADDYVTKPFSITELLARVRSLLRRRVGEADVLRFGAFELDLRSRRLLENGREVTLTPKEFALLAYLARHTGRAISRDELLDRVWGRDVLVTPRSVDRCVTTIRRKIEADPRQPKHIQTVREHGYRGNFDF
ncbi:MAG: DNA-binding response regulator [Phycisphaeraceae bacterium]|nr:DNA-binding response regulator [Phycisphaeraceae bacterium]